MPPKKRNTGKKATVVRDELKINGSGLYCILPFANLDKDEKAVFKVGLAINLNHRIESYHTSYPLGVYICAILSNPPLPPQTRGRSITRKVLLTIIESFLFTYIENHGGKRIYSTTRIKKMNENKEGITEFFYTDEFLIHEAFSAGKAKFGGDLHLYLLEGFDEETGKMTSINNTANEDEKIKPNYTGKIIFKL